MHPQSFYFFKSHHEKISMHLRVKARTGMNENNNRCKIGSEINIGGPL